MSKFSEIGYGNRRQWKCESIKMHESFDWRKEQRFDQYCFRFFVSMQDNQWL